MSDVARRSQSRRVYRTPQVVVYGDIRVITQKGGSRTSDNPGSPTDNLASEINVFAIPG